MCAPRACTSEDQAQTPAYAGLLWPARGEGAPVRSHGRTLAVKIGTSPAQRRPTAPTRPSSATTRARSEERRSDVHESPRDYVRRRTCPRDACANGNFGALSAPGPACGEGPLRAPLIRRPGRRRSTLPGRPGAARRRLEPREAPAPTIGRSAPRPQASGPSHAIKTNRRSHEHRHEIPALASWRRSMANRTMHTPRPQRSEGRSAGQSAHILIDLARPPALRRGRNAIPWRRW